MQNQVRLRTALALFSLCLLPAKLDPTQQAFLRNQLWRMDQLYHENEMRIQMLEREISSTKEMVPPDLLMFHHRLRMMCSAAREGFQWDEDRWLEGSEEEESE